MIAIRILTALSTAALFACAPGLRPGGLLGASGGEGIDEGNLAYDRTACGTAPFPFWSSLTQPEIQALQGRDRAAAGDTHALLALAIFASGDVRTSAGYDSIRDRFDAFVGKERAALAGEEGAWQKGFRLHRDMHAAFFEGGAGKGAAVAAGDGAQPGYDWDQSRFTAIFATRKYNCISSAMLYLLLARELGFQARGVILPSHVFVQLDMADGKSIEVETTSPTGFDWVHDEGFYKGRAVAFFSSRGLPASTYADYKARRIVPPLELIATNMWNQHTSPRRMAAEDRRRLAEARAFLVPDDTGAQTNRFAVWSSEHRYLSAAHDTATLERFFRAVLPPATLARKRWDADSALANHIAWLPFYEADFLRGRGRLDAVLPRVDAALAWRKPQAKDGASLRANCLNEIILVSQALVKRKDFAGAEASLQRYPAFLKEDANFRATLAWAYQEWADAAWERKDWVGAAQALGKSLPYAAKEYQKPLRGNLEAAYLNWSIGYRNEGDWPKAKAVLRECVDRLPDGPRCLSQMQELAAQHNLGE